MSDESELDTMSLLTKNKSKKSLGVKKLTHGSKLSNVPQSNSRSQIKSISNSSLDNKVVEEKLHDLKDTSDLLAEALTVMIEPLDDNRHNFSIASESTGSEPKVPQVPISSNEFADMSHQVFSKFRRSVVRLILKYTIKVIFRKNISFKGYCSSIQTMDTITKRLQVDTQLHKHTDNVSAWNFL